MDEVMGKFVEDFNSFELFQGTIKNDDGTNAWAGLFLGRLIKNAVEGHDLMITAFVGPAAPILQQVEAKFPGKEILWSIAIDKSQQPEPETPTENKE